MFSVCTAVGVFPDFSNYCYGKYIFIITDNYPSTLAQKSLNYNGKDKNVKKTNDNFISRINNGCTSHILFHVLYKDINNGQNYKNQCTGSPSLCTLVGQQ